MSVQGSVAALAFQPSGYAIEAPYSVEVKLSLSGGVDGGAGVRGAGVAVGARVAVGSGVAVGPGPAPGPLGEPSNCEPATRATTTAAVPKPTGMSLFKAGILHGPMTARCRRSSTSARTAS